QGPTVERRDGPQERGRHLRSRAAALDVARRRRPAPDHEPEPDVVGGGGRRRLEATWSPATEGGVTARLSPSTPAAPTPPPDPARGLAPAAGARPFFDRRPASPQLLRGPQPAGCRRRARGVRTRGALRNRAGRHKRDGCDGGRLVPAGARDRVPRPPHPGTL